MRRDLTIARLGHQGDGIADTESGPVYVPFTLPGERIAAEIDGNRGRLLEILQASPERIAPVCRHFGLCGGCALQHLEWRHYLDWKRQRVTEALRLEGIAFEPEPVRAFGPHTRRRATFTAIKSGGALALGYRRAQSHELVDIAECPILLPRLETALPGLRDFLRQLLPEGEARIVVTACDNGLDLLIEKTETKLRAFTPALGKAAEALGIARLVAGKDLLLRLATPQISFAGIPVELPPGAFLQASREAEAAMAEIAVGSIGKAKKVADLFCGLGAFTFALARKAAVTAVEHDRTMLAALDAATRRAQGIKPVKTLARDLMREPLSPPELNAFDAVLFDPPRAGALAQATALAKSRVPAVIAVSCNPASFAADARALIGGGFKLKRLVPIDQFVYSAHVELVAVFGRK
ncbi:MULTISPECIES: class I SAM-dependent RNA methyltransferase [Rhodomicrobium]|uniref:class I SAM-dependent RNA methyltransferase n=1 Tax=Rhodomicrobium TaxID=1068 RepID=UPI000B4B8644|nr:MULTISPECIES: class I SAM-dependent RNA methyltransferase [Rhodomicrobium]